MTAMSASDFYDFQFPAKKKKKLNFPLIPFCSLKTFHQSDQLNIHYKKKSPEPATKDNKNHTKLYTQTQGNLLMKFFLISHNSLKIGKGMQSKNTKSNIQSVFPYMPKTNNKC
jgi:hypothetical protein